MKLLPALLLALGLLQVQANRTRRQGQLRCHVCEQENSFDCTGAVDCDNRETFCHIVALGTAARYVVVSKQCSQYCPVIEIAAPTLPKGYLLERPTPFLYVKCCRGNLCNERGPELPGTTFREQAGQAHEWRCGVLVPTLLTTVSAALVPPGLP